MSNAQDFPYRQYVEDIWNQRKLDLADNYYTPDVTLHSTAPGIALGKGVEHFKGLARGFFASFPDAQFTVEEVIAQDDRLAARLIIEATHRGEFLGVAPSGKRIRIYDYVNYRIEDNKIAEVWSLIDMALLLEQIGAVSLPGG